MCKDDEDKKKFARRLALADYVLTELAKGHYPTLTEFLANTRFDIHEIIDGSPFDAETEKPDLEKLLEASRITATVHLSMEGTPRGRLFYSKKDLTDGEASLLASAFQHTTALAYAAIGLDMTGLCVDKDALSILAKRNDHDV